MEVIYQQENTHIIRFDRGEDVLELLRHYCQEQNIHAGSFWAIGAAKGLTLAEYDLEKKEYRTRDLDEMLEIASMTGNIAQDAETSEVMLHAHGVFATLAETHAGHIMQLTVGITCEVTLTAFSGEVKRQLNEEIGLKLLTNKLEQH